MKHNYRSGWDFSGLVTRPALLLAPASFLDDIRANLASEGVQDAVARQETAPIFDWLMKLVQLQGISDAIAFADKHGLPHWADIASTLRQRSARANLRHDPA